MNTLPIKYTLEIYEDSFINDPCIAHQSDSPFMTFSVGDLFDPRSIIHETHDCPKDHWWRIDSVVHRVWEIEGSDIGHQIGISVTPVPAPYTS